MLDGTAGEALLDTYEAERRPAAAFTVEQAYTRYVLRAAPSRVPLGYEPQVTDDVIDLGYRYRSAAIASEPGEFVLHGSPRESLGVPGSRAVHVDLERDGERLSPHDLVGLTFALLTGPEGDAWLEPAARAAAELGAPLDVHRIGAAGGLADPEGVFLERYGIGPSGASLLRPDGFVAWRATDDSGADALPDVLRRILARA